MPNLYYSEVDARTLRSNSPVIPNTANADAFGASIGQAARFLGAATKDVGDVFAAKAEQEKKKRNAEEEANLIAMFDVTDKELAIRNDVGASGEGYHQRVKEMYLNSVSDYVSGIKDNDVRMAVRTHLLGRLPEISANAAKYEFSLFNSNGTVIANEGLNLSLNKIYSDPYDFHTPLQDGYNIIDSRHDMSEAQKQELRLSFKHDAFKMRSEGRINNATSLEDLGMLSGDLEMWQADMLPVDYDKAHTTIKTYANQIKTQSESLARGMLSNLEDRVKDGYELPASEIKALQQRAAGVDDYTIKARTANIVRKNDWLTLTKGLNPKSIRALIEDRKNVSTTNLPSSLSTAINTAVENYDGVSATLLTVMLQREYGMHLKGEDTSLSEGTSIKDAAGNPTSSAVGPFQFTKGTFLSVFKTYDIGSTMGLDTSKMTDDAILELRKDPLATTLAAAAYAAENKGVLEASLKRSATDAEVYMAHFLGVSGAYKFISAYKNSPESLAKDIVPNAAASNAPVFKQGDRDLTVQEVYENISMPFISSKTAVQALDVDFNTETLNRMEKRLNDDPVSVMKENARFNVQDVFEPGGFQARASLVEAGSDYYDKAIEDFKPFTATEADTLRKYITEGNAEDIVGVLGEISSMGPKVSKAAFKQIGDYDPLFAYAGRLYSSGGASSAISVIRGMKKIKENPSILKQINADDKTVAFTFSNIVKDSMRDMIPSTRQAVQDAAFAYMVETKGTTNLFNTSNMNEAVRAVVGGTPSWNPIASVNGKTTILPKNVSAVQMQNAFKKMSISDWANMSMDGRPPRYADGNVADVEELQDDAKLVPVDFGYYKVMLADGSFLMTGDIRPDGKVKFFIFSPTEEKIKRLLQ